MNVLSAIRAIAGSVPDPELDPLTLADLGILRDVRVDDGRVVVELVPTHLACPALPVIAATVRDRLAAAGAPDVEVRLSLHPPWSSDDITAAGRDKLREAGIAPPSRVSASAVAVTGIRPPAARPGVVCPRCGSDDTAVLAAFGSALCRSLHRCRACTEPFERVRER